MTNLIDLGICRDSSDILAETAKAYRVSLRSGVTSFGGERPVWVPKSVAKWTACQPGYGETLHVPAWFARKLT